MVNKVKNFDDEEDDDDTADLDDDYGGDEDPYFYRFVEITPGYTIGTHDPIPSFETEVMPTK